MKYKLKTDFWDGQKLHRQGAVLDFPEGKAPTNSTSMSEPKPTPKASDSK